MTSSSCQRHARKALLAILISIVGTLCSFYWLDLSNFAPTSSRQTSERNGMPPQRFCTLPSPDASGIVANNHTIPIFYGCAGVEYERFGQKLREFANEFWKANDTHLHESRRLSWGRRIEPMPAKKLILLMGNSHTRQMVTQWICQYRDQIASVEPLSGLPRYHLDRMDFNSHYRVTFQNGARIVVICNSPIVYAKNWKGVIEDLISDTPDAIVLGRFNRMSESAHTNFARKMRAHASEFPDSTEFQFDSPPELADVLEAYERSVPVVAVGAFSARFELWNEQVRSTIRNKTSQLALRHLDGRRYVSILGEGASESRESVNGTCFMRQNQPGRRTGTDVSSMHRCTGEHSGHPGLLAWDLIEAIYQILEIGSSNAEE